MSAPPQARRQGQARRPDVFAQPPPARRTQSQAETESMKRAAESAINEILFLLQRRTSPELEEALKTTQGPDPILEFIMKQGYREAFPVANLKKWKAVIELPRDGTPEREMVESALRQHSEFFEVAILGNKAEITSKLYLPEGLRPGDSLNRKLAGLLKKISESGDVGRMLAANACFLELRDYLSAAEIQAERAATGGPFSGLFKEIGELQKSIASNLEATLEKLAKGETSSLEELEENKGRLVRTMSELERVVAMQTAGEDMISRIGRGIREGAGYTLIDRAYFNELRDGFRKNLKNFKNFAIRYHGEMNDVQEKRMHEMLAQVEHMETLAWKADLAAVKRDLGEVTRGEQGELPRLPGGPPRISGPASAEFSVSAEAAAQTTPRAPRSTLRPKERAELLASARARLHIISGRAEAYCELMDAWLLSKNTSLDSDEKREMREGLRGSAELARGVSRRLQGYTEDAHQLRGNAEEGRVHKVSERLERSFIRYLDNVNKDSGEQQNEFLSKMAIRRSQQILISDKTPFTQKLAAFNQIMILDCAPAILAGGTIVGGAIGGVAGGVPTKGVGFAPGAGAGAAFGWKAASTILFSAALFNTTDALLDYVQASALGTSGEIAGRREEAMARLRASAFHLGWGIGGGLFSGARSASGLAAARTTSAAAWSTLAASHAILAADDIKEYVGDPENGIQGNPDAFWRIPRDVGLAAIGSWGAIRTVRGWKQIAVPAHVAQNARGSVLLGGSFRAEMFSLEAGLPRALARAYKGGYSPPFVGLNTAFSAATALPRMQRLANEGKYAEALEHFGQDFARFSGEMVLFDFLIVGVPGTVRAIRLSLPTTYARRVGRLQAEGLYTKLAEAAQKAGVNVGDTEIQRALLEIAFKKNPASVTSAHIKRALRMSGPNADKIAKEIATLRAEAWKGAAEAIPARGARGVRADAALKEQVDALLLNMRAQAEAEKKAAGLLSTTMRGAGRLAAPVLVGALAYHTYGISEKELRDEEITEASSPYEQLTFIQPMVSEHNDGRIIPKINRDALYSAMREINSICEETDVVNDLPIYGQDGEKRRWALLGCALGIMMDGNPPTREAILKAADVLQEAADRAEIELTFPQGPRASRRGNHLSTVALLSNMASSMGAEKFAEMHKGYMHHLQKGLSGLEGGGASLSRDERRVLLDYEAASLYASFNIFSRYDAEWAGSASSTVFDFLERRFPASRGQALGWELALAFRQMRVSDPDDVRIVEAIDEARTAVDSLLGLSGGASPRDRINDALLVW